MTNWELPLAERHLVVPHADHFATVAITPAWSINRTGRTIGEHRFYAVN